MRKKNFFSFSPPHHLAEKEKAASPPSYWKAKEDLVRRRPPFSIIPKKERAGIFSS